MGSMTSPKADQLYDTLFEISNDIRHKILLLLKEQPERVTQISKKLELISPEVSRHLTRLSDSKLIQKDLNNYYHVTGYGLHILDLIGEMEFFTKNREYFISHNALHIPVIFKQRLPELSKYHYVNNFMEFLNFIDEKINEAVDYVWLCIDQYPIIAVDSLLNAVERGVKVRVIEQSDLSGPTIAFEDKHLLALGDEVPDVMVKVHERKDVYLFISDAGNAISFPTGDRFDYSGFTTAERGLGPWGEDLYNHYWENSKSKMPVKLKQYAPDSAKQGKTITVDAHTDPELNSRAIQNAVDNYDEIIQRGKFRLAETKLRNAGPGTGYTVIKIRKSVIIRGEGREEDIPSTKIIENSWKFPSELDWLIEVDGNGIDVVLENLHFQDFNGSCIVASRGNSVVVRDNRITIPSGLGRGQSYPNIGDYVIGITAWSPDFDKGQFPGGVLIEGNYLDFALGYHEGGFIPRRKVLNPEYRPDPDSRESYLCYGIHVNSMLGEVVIRKNVIRNMNTGSIVVQDNYDSSSIHIEGNTVVSEVFGSYAPSRHYAGIGIQALGAYGAPRSGTTVVISGNEIRCDKLNYCGIAVYVQSMYREGAGKLGECIIKNNHIHLEDGSDCILIRKNDETKVVEDIISGTAYYGVHLWGSDIRDGFDLSSSYNLVKDNDLSGLTIKSPDEYSNNHVDGRMFTGSEGKSKTAHFWLNKYTRNNVVKLQENENIIDEGDTNKINIPQKK